MIKKNFLAVSGSHGEMGSRQGAEFAADIKGTFKRVLGFDGIKLVKPFFMPKSVFGWFMKREIASKWLGNIRVMAPHQYERLLGIAAGADTPMEELLSIQALEVMADDVSLVIEGCFSAALHPSRTASGEPAVIKNFDFIRDFTDDNIARVSSPKTGFASFELTYKQITGSHDGMNEKGLVITYNYGLTAEKTEARLPITLLVQEILENCATVEQALALVGNFRFPNAAILTVADVSGAAASVEITPEHIAVRRPANGAIVNTNFFSTDEIKKFDIPRSATYSKKAPAGIRGRRIHETNELRYDRAMELINSNKKLSEEDLIKVLSDHSGAVGSEDTICRHGDFFRTQVSAIFYPRRRRILVSFGFPCLSEFSEYIF